MYEAVQRYYPASEWVRAICIAGVETGGTYDNGLVGAAGEVSLWQLHPIHAGRFDLTRAAQDVGYATWAAHQLWQEWGWQPWTAARWC